MFAKVEHAWRQCQLIYVDFNILTRRVELSKRKT